MNREQMIAALKARGVSIPENATDEWLKSQVGNKPSGNWFTVKDEAGSATAQVNIFDRIGKSWYGDDGIAAKDFKAELDTVPADREIRCLINTVGGNVWDGMAIYSMLAARRSHVTCEVIGVAASIGSVIALAGKKCVMSKGALMMVHPPQALAEGDADALREIAEKLDVHAKAIANVYAEKTGKSQAKCLAMMSKETWMTCDEAMDQGLCDEVGTSEAITNEAKNFDFSKFKSLPETLRKEVTNTAPQGAKTKGSIMSREEIIALLKSRGVTVANDATDAWLKDQVSKLVAPSNGDPTPPINGNATPPENVVNLENRVKQMETERKAERKAFVSTIIDGLITECRVTAAEREFAIEQSVASDAVLNIFRNRPQVLPGVESLGTGVPGAVSEDVRNVSKAILVHTFKGPQSVENAAERSQEIGRIYKKEREKLILNVAATNTVGADLKRVFILQETIRDFATRVFPARLFSTVFSDIPLMGTDEVVVPYYPLQTVASSDVTSSNIPAYVFGQATTTNTAKITVNKRKYQPLDYSSQEFRRQPFLDVVRLGKINAEKLGVDIINDILSVITVANFGAAVATLSAAAWTSDTVAQLRGVANGLNWPDGGRGLLVDNSVDTALTQDPAYKLALNIGTNSVITEGRFPKLSGFEYAWMPSFPTNGEKLIAAIVFASGILAAFAPVMPAPGVRAQLVAYEVATDPTTGISMNYRHWGVAMDDRDYEVIESAYGYKKGVTAAIGRVVVP